MPSSPSECISENKGFRHPLPQRSEVGHNRISTAHCPKES